MLKIHELTASISNVESTFTGISHLQSNQMIIQTLPFNSERVYENQINHTVMIITICTPVTSSPCCLAHTTGDAIRA